MSDETSASTPLVSVILPTYNRAWTVADAIDSVLAQEYDNFELIVVDDGSTDDTVALLAGYGDQIRVVSQDNRGVSAARNRGIEAAEGELLAFVDSDDYWLAGKLRTQVDYMAAHPEIAICQTEERWIRNGRRVNPGFRHKKPAGDIFVPSLALCLISPSAVMLRRELLDTVGGFDETLPACEDYDLWLQITSQYPVGLIETPLIVKRGGHADQLSQSPALDKYRIYAIQKVMAGGRLTERQYRAAAEMLCQKCRIYAQGCEKRGKTEEARYYRALVGPGVKP
ncbi:MAG: glycosyltransferase family 2 protein [Thermodesulfobacteriota bacterium]